MRQIRRAEDRGHANHGWLDTHYTFSFADYYDPRHVGFRALRVINEDRVLPGQGFGMHPHRDMEIITYVLSGQLQHRDSLGHGAVLRPGELQHLTAGTGIRHSEFNPSETEAVHLYQIWLLPRQKGLTPGYTQKSFTAREQRDCWRLVASPDGVDGSLAIQQDARLYLSDLTTGGQVVHSLEPGRHAWLQVLRGSVVANGLPLGAGDGLAVSDEPGVVVRANEDAEVLLFDLA